MVLLSGGLRQALCNEAGFADGWAHCLQTVHVHQAFVLLGATSAWMSTDSLASEQNSGSYHTPSQTTRDAPHTCFPPSNQPTAGSHLHDPRHQLPLRVALRLRPDSEQHVSIGHPRCIHHAEVEQGGTGRHASHATTAGAQLPCATATTQRTKESRAAVAGIAAARSCVGVSTTATAAAVVLVWI